jgi:hypothetical protein
MFKRATRMRGQNSALGMVRAEPLAFARPSIPNPPKKRQRVRKVQGKISPKAIFIIGQESPQKMERPASRAKPTRGSVSGTFFTTSLDRCSDRRELIIRI